MSVWKWQNEDRHDAGERERERERERREGRKIGTGWTGTPSLGPFRVPYGHVDDALHGILRPVNRSVQALDPGDEQILVDWQAARFGEFLPLLELARFDACAFWEDHEPKVARGAQVGFARQLMKLPAR